MTRWLRPLAPLFVLVCVPGLFADDPNKKDAEAKGTENYYPINLETTWHYKIGEKKAIAKVVDHKKDGNLTVAKIETTVDGMKVAEEEIAHNSDGIVRISYAGEKPKTPLLIWKAGVKTGAEWEVKTELNGTPIEGKFKAGEDKVKLTLQQGDKKEEREIACVTATGEFTLQGKTAKFIYWFAKDIGIVKLQMSVEGQDILLELEEYKPGK